jgi:serine/threonine protein kinase
MLTLRLGAETGAEQVQWLPFVDGSAALSLRYDGAADPATPSYDAVAYKVKTTNSSRYVARPSTGWVVRGDQVDVRITCSVGPETGASSSGAAASTAAPAPASASDKFLVEFIGLLCDELPSVYASATTTVKQLLQQQVQPLGFKPLLASLDASAVWRTPTLVGRLETYRLVAAFRPVSAHSTIPRLNSSTAIQPKPGLLPSLDAGSPLRVTAQRPSEPASRPGVAASTEPPQRTEAVSTAGLMPVAAPKGVLNLAPFSWREGPMIGHGAFGVVKLGMVSTTDSASTHAPGAPVAVKEIPLTAVESWSLACKEAFALRLCAGHPNIVACHGLMRLPPSQSSPLERAALVMDYLPGGTLALLASSWHSGSVAAAPRYGAAAYSNDRLRNKGAASVSGLPPDVAQTYVRSLVSAVAHVHSLGLAHRDIKGANLLLAFDGSVKLVDFGSAKLGEEMAAKLTQEPLACEGDSTGLRLLLGDDQLGGPTGVPRAGDAHQNHSVSRREQGTLRWMAPEVVLGGLRLQSAASSAAVPEPTLAATAIPFLSLGWWQKADVWSIGCTVLEVLTAKSPWHGLASDSATVMLHMASTDLRTTLPAWIHPLAADFIRSCLDPDPAKRPSAASLQLHPFLTSHIAPTDTDLVSPSSPSDSRPKTTSKVSKQAGKGGVRKGGEQLLPAGVFDEACRRLRRHIPLSALSCRWIQRWVATRKLDPEQDSWAESCLCSDAWAHEDDVKSVLERFSDALDETAFGALWATLQSRIGLAPIPHGAEATWLVCGAEVSSGVDELGWSMVTSPACAHVLEAVAWTAVHGRFPASSTVSAPQLQLLRLALNLLHARVGAWSFSACGAEGSQDVGFGVEHARVSPQAVSICVSWLAAARASMQAAAAAVSPSTEETYESTFGTDKVSPSESEMFYGDVWDDSAAPYTSAAVEDGCAVLDPSPAYAHFHFARIHAWAGELRVACMVCASTRRLLRDHSGSTELQQLLAAYSRVERRIYSRYLWFRRAWAAAAQTTGILQPTDASDSEDCSEDESSYDSDEDSDE